MSKSSPISGSDPVLVPDFCLRGQDSGSDLVLVHRVECSFALFEQKGSNTLFITTDMF